MKILSLLLLSIVFSSSSFAQSEDPKHSAGGGSLEALAAASGHGAALSACEIELNQMAQQLKIEAIKPSLYNEDPVTCLAMRDALKGYAQLIRSEDPTWTAAALIMNRQLHQTQLRAVNLQTGHVTDFRSDTPLIGLSTREYSILVDADREAVMVHSYLGTASPSEAAELDSKYEISYPASRSQKN